MIFPKGEWNQFYPLGLKPEHINLNGRGSTVFRYKLPHSKYQKALLTYQHLAQLDYILLLSAGT